MRGTTHLAAGLAAGALILNKAPLHYDIKSTSMFLAAAGISALIPDIDIKTSFIRRKIDTFSVPAGLFIIPVLLFFLLLYRFIPVIFMVLFIGYVIAGYLTPHRTFTHSFWGLLTYLIAVKAAFPFLLLPALAGYVSHILLDLLTMSGIEPLYPLKYNVGLRLVKSGGIIDHILGTLFIVFFIVFYHNFSHISGLYHYNFWFLK